MRCACIDIGSNTTRLLVGEPHDGRLREVLAERVFNRTAPSLVETVGRQVRAAREAGAGDITIVATAALRGDPAGAGRCAAIEAAVGIPVTVLTGEEEARLAFRGATAALEQPPASGLIAVVDVGGGSSEIVCGSAGGEVRWSASVPIGSGSLTDGWLAGDPPTAAELGRAEAHAAPLFAGLAPPGPVVAACAVGGSATSLRRLVGETLDLGPLAGALRRVCADPCAETARALDLHPERARVLPAALLLLKMGIVVLGVPLRVVPGGLREGLLLERSGASPGAAKKNSQLSGGSAC